MMPAAFAFSTPFLTDWQGEPMIACRFALLPTGSMLEADQMINGEICCEAVLARRLPAGMLAPAGAVKRVFPDTHEMADRIDEFIPKLANGFEQHLYKLQMMEDLSAHE